VITVVTETLFIALLYQGKPLREFAWFILMNADWAPGVP